jgi:hypothetical protein
MMLRFVASASIYVFGKSTGITIRGWVPAHEEPKNPMAITHNHFP